MGYDRHCVFCGTPFRVAAYRINGAVGCLEHEPLAEVLRAEARSRQLAAYEATRELRFIAGEILERVTVFAFYEASVPWPRGARLPRGAGPLPDSRRLRFDAIGMPRRKLRPTDDVYVIEIKRSRNDFNNDRKWPLYRRYADFLAFLVPEGLLRADDLPNDVGVFEALPAATPPWRVVHPWSRLPRPRLAYRELLSKHLDVPVYLP